MEVKKTRDAREASLLALLKVEEQESYSNLALSAVLSEHTMDPRDKALAAEITYGVISHKLTLDWMISHVAGRPVAQLDALILMILRIGFYQLFFLDRIPAPAAVHSTVELAKRGKKKGLAPFVNGVLRGALRKKDTLPWPDREKGEAAYLSLRYSHPDWLVARWLSRYGSEETEALLKANNRPAPVALRTNTLRVTREALISSLCCAGVDASPSEAVPEGIILKSGGRVVGLPAYRQGLFYVQGESAMLASRTLNPAAGERILDACSAPGGKTTHLAQLMENKGEVLALDIYPRRLELVAANCRRLGINIVRTESLDARELTVDKVGNFDKILLDVPCSGFGVIRRKPDLKWRRHENDIGNLAAVQHAMLSSAVSLLKRGGILLYSTCTNEPEETDEVVNRVVAEIPRLSFADTAPFLPEPWRMDAKKNGIHLLPHRHGVDGFFLSLLTVN
jgi:16S rRNA (cytosine967-C5)-methyltransferase